MPQIERFLPTSIKPKQGMAPGVSRPGVVLTDFSSGYQTSRDWGEISTRSLDIPVEMIGYATDGLRDFEAFLENVRVVGEVFWVVEPISGTHYGMTCGPLGDASRTCFVIPINGAVSNDVILVDGAPQTGHTIHETANRILEDNSCSPETTTGWGITYGSRSIKLFSRFGANSLEVSPGGAFGVEVYTGHNDRAEVTAGETITALADVYDTKAGGRDFKFEMNYYDGGGSPLSTSLGSLVASDGGEWKVLSDSFVVPASATTAYVNLIDQTTDTSHFYIDAWAIAPGDYDRIHLPSMAPGVIELAGAPAEGARVTAHATGKRMIRGRLGKNGVSWSMTDPGNAVPSSLSIMEEVEV